MDAVTHPPAPTNEPVRTYAPGSAERGSLAAAARGARRRARRADDDDRRRAADGRRRRASRSSRRTGTRCVLGQPAQATARRRARPPSAPRSTAAPAWRDAAVRRARRGVPARRRPAVDRPWRDRLNAATMLGQSKTVHQAEIDAACELADFLRFNVHFARQILGRAADQRRAGVWNRMDYRPLEGFVLAITPFNFTAIAGNLPSAPALMGNVVVWKPSPTQQLAAHYTMRLFEAAGLPPGVINLVTGDGAAVSEVALPHPALAGIHFTGSTATFQQPLAHGRREHRRATRRYPRLVGETGGKDFVVAHPCADADALVTGAGARRVRVPGPEVLGRVARVRAAVAVGRWRARRAGRDRPSR